MPRNAKRPRLLLLSRLYQTDRVLLETEVLDRLLETTDVVVWSKAPSDATWDSTHRHAKCFQSFPHGDVVPNWLRFLRKIDAYAWDQRPLAHTRRTFYELKGRRVLPAHYKLFALIGRVTYEFGKKEALDLFLRSQVLREGGKSPFREYMRVAGIDAVVSMHPFHHTEWGIAAAAKSMGIPCYAYITSWDNVTTQERLVVPFDGYIVWSKALAQELLLFYPEAENVPVFAPGAPQYDLFHRSELLRPRSDFLGVLGLDPERPVILYSFGSPDLIREDYGALEFLRRCSKDPELRRLQFIVRLHPAFPAERYSQVETIVREYPGVVLQSLAAGSTWESAGYGDNGRMVEWINTLRHADVLINLASTMVVDACVAQTPVVNVDFDPEPGGPNEALVRAINHAWTHFRPITDAAGMKTVRTYDEMAEAVRGYLRDPVTEIEGRRRIIERIGGKVDGHAGQRLAVALSRLAHGCRKQGLVELEPPGQELVERALGS